jgi:hypothetical protein
MATCWREGAAKDAEIQVPGETHGTPVAGQHKRPRQHNAFFFTQSIANFRQTTLNFHF